MFYFYNLTACWQCTKIAKAQQQVFLKINRTLSIVRILEVGAFFRVDNYVGYIHWSAKLKDEYGKTKIHKWEAADSGNAHPGSSLAMTLQARVGCQWGNHIPNGPTDPPQISHGTKMDHPWHTNVPWHIVENHCFKITMIAPHPPQDAVHALLTQLNQCWKVG